MKMCELKERINDIAKVAGVAGAYTDRDDRRYPAEVEVMYKEASMYRKQFHLDGRELRNAAENLNENMDKLLQRIDMRSYEYGTSEEKFAWFYQQYDYFKPVWYIHGIPYFGEKWKAVEYQKQCEITLKSYLDICVEDVRKLQSQIKHSMKGT